MNTERDTRQKLLDSAEKEFIEKGYAKASLRSICTGAGVTTGALYFFFRDKEDLFEEVVKQPLQELYDAVRSHFETESVSSQLPDEDVNDVEAAESVLRALYRRRDLFLMLLTRSQGSCLENIRDRFVSFVEDHYRGFAVQYGEFTGKQFHGEKLLHWVAHNQVDLFVFVLEHCESEEEAMGLVPGLVSYLIGGWNSMFD